jgi:hypothetical protein
MRSKSMIGRVGVFVICLLVSMPALASIPVRGSSRNGENGSAAFWAALGPTQLLTLVQGTTKVMYKEQVVCPQQDFANASDPTDTQNAGACESGSYLFIYQLRSTSTNVSILLSGIMGFTPDSTSPNYGVMLCDSTTNTLELCTTATQDQLPAITFTPNSTNTTATFFIPSFPNFKDGPNHEGQGITIFILTQQTGPRPVSIPRIALK